MAEFLNVDLELHGISETAARDILLGLGDDVFVLSNSTTLLSVELNDVPAAGLQETLMQFVALVRALPGEARRAWASASRRSFTIGVRSDRRPKATEFTIDLCLLRSLVDLEAEVAFTVYPALDE